jgi:hypothetical protein
VSTNTAQVGSLKVEECPETKKARGAYYTPTYIVEYIVENTVGKLLEGRDPTSTAELRILDPACGAGVFLIGAYQYLLDWHLGWYLEHDPDRAARGRRPAIYRRPHTERGWALTVAERKRILLNNIFGVDIDPQAVEAARLALLSKALNGEAIGQTLRPSPKRALPDLAANIQCGNSLIGPDFYDDPKNLKLPLEERMRINAFDWRAAFPHIMGPASNQPRPGITTPASSRQRPLVNPQSSIPNRQSIRNPGFDAVIGNPPYLSYSGRQAVDLPGPVREYLLARYESTAWPTAHAFFIERSVKELSSGYVSFIVPDQVGHLHGYETVRKVLSHHSRLVEVRYWGEHVFDSVVTPALTFVAHAHHKGGARIRDSSGRVRTMAVAGGRCWGHAAGSDLLAKLEAQGESLGNLVADIGVHTGNCAKHLVLPQDRAGPDAVPVLEGKQVSRYGCRPPVKFLRLGYRRQPGEYFTIRPQAKYAAAPFLIRQTAPHPIVGPRKHAAYFRNSLLALYPPSNGTDIRYVVGLLNCTLMRYVYSQQVPESRQKAFPQVKVGSLRRLPIRRIDPANPSDKAAHDRIVALVDEMLVWHERLSMCKTTKAAGIARHQIRALDAQIDATVYELYGLSSDQVDTVTGADAPPDGPAPLTGCG